MVGQAVRTALVLGGADCLFDDLAAYRGPIDGVAACNEAGAEWPANLDAWVSLHPRYWEGKGWRAKREANGYKPAKAFFAHEAARPQVPGYVTKTEYLFPGQGKSGSSGLFAAKVALIDLGFDRAVLCGIPMNDAPHFWDAEQVPWKSATVQGFRSQWLTVPSEYRDRMRSMSGWTRNLLGAPQNEKELQNA